MCAPLFLSKNQTNILTNIEKNVAYYSCFMNNRPIVYRYTILEVLMNIFKSIKKQLKFCIKAMDSSSSLFVVNPEKDFTRKRKHLFGDILSDEASMLSGSIGLLPSASIGGKAAVYEPIHGSAPDIAGMGIANPIATIASASMLLRYSLGEIDAANAIDNAIETTLKKGYRTKDIANFGAKEIYSTEQMGSIIAQNI